MPRERTSGPRGIVGGVLLLSIALALPAGAQPATTAQPVVVAFEIAGVESVSERELRAALHTRASPRLPWRPRVRLDPATLDGDIRRTEEFYAARGFPDAAVTSELVPAGRDAVRVRLLIEEGDPIVVGRVLFEGLEGILEARAAARLAERAPLQSGEPLSRPDVQATAQLALDLVRDRGYPYAQVSVAEWPAAPERRDVTFSVAPGIRGFFGATDITGNRLVDDSVIRRYLAFRPGEPFELGAIRLTQQRLAALGLFETIDIELVDPDPESADVRTAVRVDERDQREYEFSFGYGTEEQLSGEVEWRHLNFLGGARRLSLLGRWSWLDRGVQGRFAEPYLFRPDLALGLQGQAWWIDERFYDVLSLGGAASLHYQRGAHNLISLTFAPRFQRSRLDESLLRDPDLLTGLEAAGVALERSGLLAAVQLDLVRDTRDVPADATRGYRAALRLEQAGGWLPGTFDLYSAVADVRHFHSVGGLTVAHRVQYGSVVPTGPSPDVPLFRRFFLGGADSLRGWGRLEVSPLSPTGQPLGGRAFVVGTSELRVPIVTRLGAAVFLDAGSVWPEAWSLRPRDLRYSAGAGVRYWSPFGPMRLDAGYQLTPVADLRIDNQPQERRWRVHFSFGHGF